MKWLVIVVGIGCVACVIIWAHLLLLGFVIGLAFAGTLKYLGDKNLLP